METIASEQLAGYVQLAEVLANVPPERVALIDEKLSIFVAGMEAMAWAMQPVSMPTLSKTQESA